MNTKPVCRRVNRVRDIDIVPCPRRRCQKSSDALVKKKKKKRREARRSKVQRTPPAGQIATFFSTPSLLRL